MTMLPAISSTKAKRSRLRHSWNAVKTKAGLSYKPPYTGHHEFVSSQPNSPIVCANHQY